MKRWSVNLKFEKKKSRKKNDTPIYIRLIFLYIHNINYKSDLIPAKT